MSASTTMSISGCASRKRLQARDQQCDCERRLDTDPKQRLSRLGKDTGEPQVDSVEAGRQLVQQRPAGLRQFDALMQSLEKLPADEHFQFPDLPADCRLRHEELFSSTAEAQQSTRSLEASQSRQWQTSAFHDMTLRYPASTVSSFDTHGESCTSKTTQPDICVSEVASQRGISSSKSCTLQELTRRAKCSYVICQGSPSEDLSSPIQWKLLAVISVKRHRVFRPRESSPIWTMSLPSARPIWRE